jgi:hypothetical protein
MRTFSLFGAATLMCAIAACAQAPAAEVESGIGVGSRIGAYTGTKAGGIEDGVNVGAALCYT